MTGLRLDPRQQALLCDLADPEAPVPSADMLACIGPDDLLALARHHAIEAIVWRKLTQVRGWPDAGWAAATEALAARVRIATGVTMLLEAHAARISGALDGKGLPHRLVKGADFAAALYPDVADRPFTDIDILVPAEALAETGIVLRQAGFDLSAYQRADRRAASGEQKWTREGEPHLLIEVHTDLVHAPALRRRVTFGYREAVLADAEGASPASGRLLAAVVHGAIGHKFHQLKLAVDVLQAMRRIDDAMPRAIEAARQLNLTFELAAAAGLARRLFPLAAGDGRIKALAALAGSPAWLDRDTVVNAYLRADLRSRLRRHAFRWHQFWRGERRS